MTCPLLSTFLTTSSPLKPPPIFSDSNVISQTVWGAELNSSDLLCLQLLVELSDLVCH